jgi:predicted kinase
MLIANKINSLVIGTVIILSMHVGCKSASNRGTSNVATSGDSLENPTDFSERHMMTCKTESADLDYVLVFDRARTDLLPGIPVTGKLTTKSREEKLEGRAEISETSVSANFGHVRLRAEGSNGSYKGNLNVGLVSHPVTCMNLEAQETGNPPSANEKHMMTCKTESTELGYVLVFDRARTDLLPGIPVTGKLTTKSREEKLEGRAEISETSVTANFGHVRLRAAGSNGSYKGNLNVGLVSHPVTCQSDQ